MQSGALDYVTWVTRNILELWVWVEYCSQSQQYSEFYQDVVRDLNDLNKAIGGVDPQGVETLQKANKFLGNAKPAHKFKNVRNAAEAVGLLSTFTKYNKLLSKFAHPTALSVLTSFEEGRADQIRKLFVEIATNVADEATQKLEVSLLGQVYRKYELSIDKVTATQQKTSIHSKNSENGSARIAHQQSRRTRKIT